MSVKLESNLFRIENRRWNYNHLSKYSMDISLDNLHDIRYSNCISDYFQNSLTREIYNKILINGDKLICDLSGKSNNYKDFEILKFHSIFKLINTKKIIVPPRLCECFLDNFTFHYKRDNGDLLGTVRNCDIFINKHVNYATNYILAVDDIIITDPIEDIYTRSQIRFTTNYEIINPKVIFVLEDGYNDDWSYYKSQIREEKINKILNE
jgi:hypothetical protein